MTFIKTAEWGDYKGDDGCRLSAFSLIDCLNEDVEIIEEPKKIGKIKQLNNVAGCKELIELEDKQQINNHILKDKINELIDKVNELKRNK